MDLNIIKPYLQYLPLPISLAALTVSILSNHEKRREERRKLLSELHKEWRGGYEERFKSRGVTRPLRWKGLKLMYIENQEASIYIWKVIHFFREVAIHAEEGDLDRHATVRKLGRSYVRFYESWFSDTEWPDGEEDTIKRLDFLMNWMEKDESRHFPTILGFYRKFFPTASAKAVLRWRDETKAATPMVVADKMPPKVEPIDPTAKPLSGGYRNTNNKVATIPIALVAASVFLAAYRIWNNPSWSRGSKPKERSKHD